MSKKVNTTSIGLFIVSGAALGVIGLLLFSSSKMFSKTREIIAYFDGTLNGLHEGAPVKFRGVTIGSVNGVVAVSLLALAVLLTGKRLWRQRPVALFVVIGSIVVAGVPKRHDG